MIVGDGFVIATPTKCGTHSWEALARAVPSMELIRPQHLMVVPEEYEDHDRYIVVRDPYERLISMWSFICHSTNRTQWGAKETRGMGLNEWLHWFLPRQAAADEQGWQFRSPWVWTKTLLQCKKAMLSGTWPLKIEEADKDMLWIAELYGIGLPGRRAEEGMYHSNRADMHRPKYRLTPGILLMMNQAGAAKDARAFGYPVR